MLVVSIYSIELACAVMLDEVYDKLELPKLINRVTWFIAVVSRLVAEAA